MEGVYLIKDNQTGLHKIGMTTNWPTRRRALKVGTVTTEIRFVQCKDSKKWEKVLHAMFRHKRIPQSEWFRITAEDAIPKMNWLASKTNQPMLIGNWQKAQAGNYYRRRRSSSGHWYTEQRSASSIKAEHEQRMNATIEYETKRLEAETRKESGFWPTKDDQTKIQWQENDPTRTQSNPWIYAAFAIGFILLLNLCNNTTERKPPSRIKQPANQSKLIKEPSNEFEPFQTAKRPITSSPVIDKQLEKPINDPVSSESDKGGKESQTSFDAEQTDYTTSDVNTEQDNSIDFLPIPLNGSLENICRNSESRLIRQFMQEGIEVQPAVQGTIYIIGLESRNSTEPPSPAAIDSMRNQYNLQQHARKMLDNCDQYSGVRFGFWTTNRWTTFVR